MDYLHTHLMETLVVLGLVLLAIEVMILGFSTFFFVFCGCGGLRYCAVVFSGRTGNLA
ncbi:hypothetical protein [Planctobacterium marinum]|uniref:hypothetical protein n=1 Tax=Planctobacterium marinum TaxID=1631968 RepID=UPI001E5F7B47|nr:hypothetical protein [Planctobacterium marinum]MCC2607916.1 hypothetical protein [Planctobacterium marinum]